MASLEKFETRISDGKVISGYLCFLSNNVDPDWEENTNWVMREQQKKHKRDKNILLAAILSLEHDDRTSQLTKQQKDKNIQIKIQQTLENHSHLTNFKKTLEECEKYILSNFVPRVYDDKTIDIKTKVGLYINLRNIQCGEMIEKKNKKILEDTSKLLKTSEISSNCEKSPSPNCSKVHSAFNDLATYLFKRNAQKVNDLYSVLNETNISYKAGKVVERQIDELKSDIPIDIEKESFENKLFDPLQLLKTFDGQIAEISEKLNEFQI
jgi:hypothetical protein